MKSIGKYEIREILGRGATGAVYKVTIPVINKIAALKLLAPGPKLVKQIGLDILCDQFIREASLIANLRHPNIVDIWDLDKTNGPLFYVMEYFCHNLGTLIGESYWADAPSRIVRPARATGYMIEILEGLRRLHQAGIVHRDIKPFNIMLTDTGTVKIADFGLSKKRGEVSIQNNNADILIGTKFYAAPEQIDNPDNVDHRADLYSAGILLYRMLTGSLPQTPPALPEKPSELNPDIDTAWDRFMLKSISPLPIDRFQNARAMSEALKDVYNHYQSMKNKACQASEGFQEVPPGNQRSAPIEFHIRSEANRIPGQRAKSVFNLNDAYRPKRYIQNQLETLINGTVFDHATGLVWQQAGSDYPVSLAQAKAYIEQLCDEHFGGHKNWRLPTVNEILSILIPPPPGEDFCFNSPFSNNQKWIWSGDSRSIKASWVVNVEMGFVMSHDVMDFFYAKAVCSPQIKLL